MDARSRPAPRSVAEDPSRLPTGIGPSHWAQAREDFHEQTAIEAVISFLQTYGCPHQMTFDRDPTLGGECVWSGFSLSVASALVVPGDHAPYLSAASTRQKRLCRAVPQNLWAGVLTGPSAQHLQ